MNKHKKFLAFLIGLVILCIAFAFLLQKNRTFAQRIILVNQQNVKYDISAVVYFDSNIPLTYPIETEDPYPITTPKKVETPTYHTTTNTLSTSTKRPTSTPWPSRTPTPTPAFIYRNTNTPVGSLRNTATLLANETRQFQNLTLTVFFITRTTIHFEKTDTQSPSDILTLTPILPSETNDIECDVCEQAELIDLTLTPTITRLVRAVYTNKSRRYKEMTQTSFPMLLIGITFVFIGITLFKRNKY
jgi:hypothetical protein